MSTRPDPVLTEEDLAALDTSEGHGEDARPEEKVNALAARLGAVIALIAGAAIIVLVAIAVALRYIWNSSLPIAAEGPTYLFPWLIAGGAIVAQASRAHIAVDALVTRLGPRGYQRAQVAIWAAVTVLLAYVTYLAVYLVGPMAAQSTPIMGWPQLGSFGAFVLMAAVMTVQAAARTVHYVRHGAPPPPYGPAAEAARTIDEEDRDA